jgi:hypothetical protein
VDILSGASRLMVDVRQTGSSPDHRDGSTMVIRLEGPYHGDRRIASVGIAMFLSQVHVTITWMLRTPCRVRRRM